MIREKKRELIAEMADDAAILDNPSFDNSIIGVSTDERVVYDLDEMIEELASDEEISLEEAADFIAYSTINANGYIPNPPILVKRIRDEEETI